MDLELRAAREKLEREQRERKERAKAKLEREKRAKAEAARQRDAIEAAQRSKRLDAARAQLEVSYVSSSSVCICLSMFISCSIRQKVLFFHVRFTVGICIALVTQVTYISILGKNLVPVVDTKLVDLLIVWAQFLPLVCF